MAELDSCTVNGVDYQLQDTTARSSAAQAYNLASKASLSVQDKIGATLAHVNVGVQLTDKFTVALPKGAFFVWNNLNNQAWYSSGTVCYTTKAVVANETISYGTNVDVVTLQNALNNIETYVGSDSKLHFKDWAGADSALNFNSLKTLTMDIYGTVLGSTQFGSSVGIYDILSLGYRTIVLKNIIEDSGISYLTTKLYYYKSDWTQVMIADPMTKNTVYTIPSDAYALAITPVFTSSTSLEKSGRIQIELN